MRRSPQRPITERDEWPKILERLAEYAAQELAPSRASEKIASEFGCGDRTVYTAIQRGDVPHYRSTDRARAVAWREGRTRYLRATECIKCGNRVFLTSDGRCLACEKNWAKTHLERREVKLKTHQETGDFYTGRGQFAEDKLFFTPKEQPEPFKSGMKLHSMAAAMLEGATLDELSMITGWIPETVSGTFAGSLKVKGYGVERRGGRYYLLLPQGLEELPII